MIYPKDFKDKFNKNKIHRYFLDRIKLADHIMSGCRLILGGDCGTGKTWTALAGCYFAETRKNVAPLFITHKEMYESLKGDYGRVNDEQKDLLSTAGCMVIDDFSAPIYHGDKIKSREERILFQDILDKRLTDSDRVTIITTNIDKDKLYESWGGRVSDRLREYFLYLEYKNMQNLRSRK